MTNRFSYKTITCEKRIRLLTNGNENKSFVHVGKMYSNILVRLWARILFISGGKHHPVDQKPPPDLPPSYRRDISSPTHHIGMPPPQMPPPAIPTHQMQQDYVDMDGVLMGGAGLGALGGTPPPPPPQLYPTMMSQRGGNQTFYGSRADDINSIEDGCKVRPSK